MRSCSSISQPIIIDQPFVNFIKIGRIIAIVVIHFFIFLKNTNYFLFNIMRFIITFLLFLRFTFLYPFSIFSLLTFTFSLTVLFKMSKESAFVTFWFPKHQTIWSFVTRMSTIPAAWARIGF